MPTADNNTWGGQFHIAPKADLRYDSDIVDIEAYGFTVQDVTDEAGRSVVLVYGPGSAIDEVTNDFTAKQRIPAWFFQIPVETEITTALLRQWAPRQDLIF